MSSTHLTHITTGLLRKMLAAVAIGALALALAGAGAAHADSKQGSGGSQGCLIENNGHLETVPVGTKISLLTCGADGEWHFGWLITQISAPPKKTVKTVGVSVVHRGSVQAAQASR
ncbi:MAG TPA: hypothetical protein VN817_02830 [Solirubrobacteraceae bacterium]|nr:hypothetical protein [Solirubrobacteraceae bacterium]